MKIMLVPPVSAAYCRATLPCFVSVHLPMSVICKGRYISAMPVDQLQRQLDVRLILNEYYSWLEVDILGWEKEVVYKRFSILGHKYIFFNAIICYLITLKTLKSQKSTGPRPLKLQKGSVQDTKLQLRLLPNCFCPCKTQSIRSYPETNLQKKMIKKQSLSKTRCPL